MGPIRARNNHSVVVTQGHTGFLMVPGGRAAVGPWGHSGYASPRGFASEPSLQHAIDTVRSDPSKASAAILGNPLGISGVSSGSDFAL